MAVGAQNSDWFANVLAVEQLHGRTLSAKGKTMWETQLLRAPNSSLLRSTIAAKQMAELKSTASDDMDDLLEKIIENFFKAVSLEPLNANIRNMAARVFKYIGTKPLGKAILTQLGAPTPSDLIIEGTLASLDAHTKHL
eukprot:SAG31_NODE_1658_length_7616_cov_2.929227_2_plen_139_part_00